MMNRPVCLFTALALVMAAACAATEDSASIAPQVDHHQHLLSPAGAALINRPLLPAIEVPAGVSSLLNQRAALTTDASCLAGLFTADAVFLGPGDSGGWVRGSDAAASIISSDFHPGYYLTPVAFRQSGDVADVFGYYSRDEGPTVRHVGYFSMNLLRNPEGTWLIASETPIFPGPSIEQPLDAARLVDMLDDAGMERAIVLSDAYYFDGLIEHSGNVYAMVQAENDWTAEQVARFPDRLVAFCSFNPLADYAIEELERCSGTAEFKGLKLHFGTSGVDLTNPVHARKVRDVVAASNRLKLPVIAHLTADNQYGRQHSEIFLNEILPVAPDITVIIAHLWGGAGYSDEALAVYAEAISAGHPATKNLYFELAQASMVEGHSVENMRHISRRIRQIGIDRILYGSDGAYGNGMPPRDVWMDLRVKLPLSDEEFRKIAANVAPFLQTLAH